ncbi:hypothetical protein ISG33_14870 [Glaciecola sp. MH2013]|uniref:hypothetical protein n=1 Tax=Glaciecola sp. MH2013 TaxID=2785524 RepID=UPI00189D0FC6|nr:hypothetical protein [Glaciecola sp. MH2013]MBF7074687.1 hypothetical protein [Glaciecola sp. MH2013]
MIKKLLSVSVIISALSAGSAFAGVHVLDFDYDAQGQKIQNGTIIDNQYAAWGVTISGCNLNGDLDGGSHVDGKCNDKSWNDNEEQRQISFDTSLSGTRDTDLEFVYDAGSDSYESRRSHADYLPLTEYENYYSNLANELPNNHGNLANAWKQPGNVMIINEWHDCPNGCSNPDDEGQRPAGFFSFDFTSPVSIVSLDFFDIEMPEAQIGTDAAKVFFHLANGTIFEQVPVLGDGGYGRETYNTMFEVTKLVVNMPGSGAINNLVYKTAEVSAPGAAILLALSLGGLVLRRKK